MKYLLDLKRHKYKYTFVKNMEKNISLSLKISCTIFSIFGS